MTALAVSTDAAFAGAAHAAAADAGAALAGVAPAGATPDAAAAEHAAQAAYRLGAAAQALGLGHVALLADALGLAWRRTAYAARTESPHAAPARRSIEQAGEALRAMLLRVAAGVAPPDSAVPLALLTQAIERAAPTDGIAQSA
jgi:hypothetical protein